MDGIETTFPLAARDLISTTVVKARAGGSSYVVVSLDPRITAVSYKVYSTVMDADPAYSICQSGDLNDHFTTGHSFVFPVEKKTLYFVVLTYNVKTDEWGQTDVQVTWLMDPV